MHDIVSQFRSRTETQYAGQRQERQIPDTLCHQAADEIERLRERCEAYKIQVEAGDKEIEDLREENEKDARIRFLQGASEAYL